MTQKTFQFCVINLANVKWFMVQRTNYNCLWRTCNCAITSHPLSPIHPHTHTHTHTQKEQNFVSQLWCHHQFLRQVDHSWPLLLHWPFQIETLWKSFQRKTCEVSKLQGKTGVRWHRTCMEGTERLESDAAVHMQMSPENSANLLFCDRQTQRK